VTWRGTQAGSNGTVAFAGAGYPALRSLCLARAYLYFGERRRPCGIQAPLWRCGAAGISCHAAAHCGVAAPPAAGHCHRRFCSTFRNCTSLRLCFMP